MKLFCTTFFIFLSLCISAQKEISFSSQNYAGLLEGEHGSSLQLQTINGIKINSWFVGVGTGIDWYFRRSIPLFGSVGKEFLKKKNRSLYLAGDAGINFSWQKDNYYNEWGYMETKSYPGFYWSAGLGYKIGIGKNNDAILIQAAYSYKHIHEKGNTGNILFDNSELNPNDKFDYHLKRLSFKIGWCF